VKEHTKRAVAYIAFRLSTEQEATGVYDQSAQKHFSFSGDVGPEHIAVHDQTQGCSITGSGSANGAEVFHAGNGGQIHSDIRDDGFGGFDQDSQSSFTGTIRDQVVVLHDLGTAKVNRYSVS